MGPTSGRARTPRRSEEGDSLHLRNLCEIPGGSRAGDSELYQGSNQAQIHEIDPFAVPRGLVSLAQPMGHFLGVYTQNGER
jgi:hypothetical protein